MDDSYYQAVSGQASRTPVDSARSYDDATTKHSKALQSAGERVQAGLGAVAFALLAVAEAIENNGYLRMEDDSG